MTTYALHDEETNQLLFAQCGRTLSRHELDLLEAYVLRQSRPGASGTFRARMSRALDEYHADTAIRLVLPEPPPVAAVIAVPPRDCP